MFSAATDKPSYIAGDPIIYSVIATNPTATTITLHFPTTQQAHYSVDDFWPTLGGGFAISERFIPAQSSVSWEFLHPWDEYSLAPGPHSIVGYVLGYGQSDPVVFDVSAPDPIIQDVLIDFEHFPDGTPTRTGNDVTYTLWEDAFIRNGVRFSSQDGTVNLTLGNGGVLLHTSSTTYPPGFNIVAEFEMPVYTVSADVGSTPGQSVRMLAFDAAGQLLGAVMSDPNPVHGLAGQLSFDSSRPIASVRWFSSVQNAGVRLDNLFLNVDLSETHGDFNGDGQTDAADYIIWRKYYGQTVPTGSAADANHDGVVTVADYNLWRMHLGQQAPAHHLSTAVPEPGASFLVTVAAVVATSSVRRTRQLAK